MDKTLSLLLFTQSPGFSIAINSMLGELRQCVLLTATDTTPDLQHPQFQNMDMIFMDASLSTSLQEGLIRQIGDDTIPRIVMIDRGESKTTCHQLAKYRNDVIQEPVFLVSTVRHSLESRAFRQQIHKCHQRYDLLLKSAAEGFWEWRMDKGEVEFSPRWLEMLGYDSDTFEPSFGAWLEIIHPEDLGRFLELWTEYMEGISDRFYIEYRVLTRQGKWLWVEAKGVSIVDDNQEPGILVGSHNDISSRKEAEIKRMQHEQELEHLVELRTRELKDANQRLLHLARYDPLTGVANRAYFNEVFERERNQAMRENLPLTLLVIDIDYFKSYNDHYGHSIGDECLKSIAQAMQDSINRPLDFVARFGGEEFILLLPNTNVNGGRCLAERIQDKLKELPSLPLNPKTGQGLTVSIGVSCLMPGDTDSVDQLFNNADKALYRAKSNGRNQIALPL